jgi:hypothetical protein
LLAQGTSIGLLHPETDATVMEWVIAFAPAHNTRHILVAHWVLLRFRLTSEAIVHDLKLKWLKIENFEQFNGTNLNTTNSASVWWAIPTPISHGIPLFERKEFFRFSRLAIIFVAHFLVFNFLIVHYLMSELLSDLFCNSGITFRWF